MRVTNERLARLLDSGAITAEVKLWRGTGVEHTSVEDVLLDLRDERALADKLRKMLRECEWGDVGDTDEPCCPICYLTKSFGHSQDCELDAALAAYDKERGR